MSTEIDEWAYITHTDDPKPVGGTYRAFDRANDALAGEFSYFFLNDDHTLIQFKDVSVPQEYRRRRVATALLRQLNLDQPQARINPGTRSIEGEVFMQHILSTEAAKVATNGVLQVPLSTMRPELWSLDVQQANA